MAANIHGPRARMHRIWRDVSGWLDAFLPLRSLRWRMDLGPAFLVWATWFFLAVGVFDYVHTFAVDIPWSDEWEIVPALTGNQPLTLTWLWSQHNEHRIAIPRLFYLAAFKLAGGDFRAAVYLNAAVLVASAASFIVVARRIRGGVTVYSDLFFPLMTLHFGQWENLSYGLHIQWMSACLFAAVALVVVVQPGRLGVKASATLGLMALLLPFCGGNGVALTPALCAAVFVAGWQLRRATPRGWWATAGIWMLGAAALAVTALYFTHYTRPAKHPTMANSRVVLEGTEQYLVMGFGSAVKSTWPNVRVALYLLTVLIAGALLVTWIRRPAERPRIYRLVCFMGAIVSLAVGTAWARRALNSDFMFCSRYASSAAPFWLAIYFAWETVGDSPVRRFGQMALFALAASYFIANRNEGLAMGGGNRESRVALQRDLRAGGKLGEVAAKHWGPLYYDVPLSVNKDTPAGPETFKKDLKMLKDRGVGDFRYLKE